MYRTRFLLLVITGPRQNEAPSFIPQIFRMTALKRLKSIDIMAMHRPIRINLNSPRDHLMHLDSRCKRSDYTFGSPLLFMLGSI